MAHSNFFRNKIWGKSDCSKWVSDLNWNNNWETKIVQTLHAKRKKGHPLQLSQNETNSQKTTKGRSNINLNSDSNSVLEKWKQGACDKFELCRAIKTEPLESVFLQERMCCLFFRKTICCLFCFRNILLPFEKHYIKIVLLPKYFVAVFVFGSARDNSRGTPLGATWSNEIGGRARGIEIIKACVAKLTVVQGLFKNLSQMNWNQLRFFFLSKSQTNEKQIKREATSGRSFGGGDKVKRMRKSKKGPYLIIIGCPTQAPQVFFFCDWLSTKVSKFFVTGFRPKFIKAHIFLKQIYTLPFPLPPASNFWTAP